MSQPDNDIAPIEVKLIRLAPGHYTSAGFTVPFAGDWKLTVKAVLGDVDEARSELEAKLNELGAEVRHQDSVFATLEVLKKEQDFLRGLVGSMLDEGKDVRQQVDDLRVESASLLAQRIEIQKELASKQAQVQVLDKAIMAKDQEVDGGRGVRSARSF